MSAVITIDHDLTYNGAVFGEAVITLTPSGQEPPDDSDQVVVTARLTLPAAAEGVAILHENLRFEDRVTTVFGALLNREWSNVSGAVAREKVYTGTVYATLQATAQIYAEAECQKVLDAIAAREAARLAAG